MQILATTVNDFLLILGDQVKARQYAGAGQENLQSWLVLGLTVSDRCNSCCY